MKILLPCISIGLAFISIGLALYSQALSRKGAQILRDCSNDEEEAPPIQASTSHR